MAISHFAAVIFKPNPAFPAADDAEAGACISLVARTYGSTAAPTGVVLLMGVGA